MSPRKCAVRLLPVAEDDLYDILTFIAADRLRASELLARKIEARLETLAEYPRLGRVPRDPDIARRGYRCLVVEDYLVFYKIEKRTVVIHRILHGARDYRRFL